MKKIINGKMYNTDTASKIAFYSSDFSANDFHYFEETLYRKKTGECFLYGKGGPASAYAERCSDGWLNGVNIVPLDEAAAKEWLERTDNVDSYIDLFGEPEE